MHANMHCMTMHDFVQINSSSFAFLKFYIMQKCTNKDLVKPNAYIYSSGFMQNLFCIFLNFIQIYENLGNLQYFLKFKLDIRIQKKEKPLNSDRPAFGPREHYHE
jgi:hypothetical protein